MRKLSLCLLFAMALLSGCFKKNDGCSFSNNNITAPASEVTDLENYLFGNGITTAVKHPTGFYYEVLSQGTGAKPELCSVVNVGYTGKLTNGNAFDQQQSISFRLGSLIEGWRKGLPLIQKGGHIKLYLPPSLGYGAVDVKDGNNVVVPANSILIFDINLIDVQ
jgi:FKBP-type peptidyl-prolyl cis-trans isomerase FkpA